MNSVSLCQLTKEQKQVYWAEYEKALEEFDESCEDFEFKINSEVFNYENV